MNTRPRSVSVLLAFACLAWPLEVLKAAPAARSTAPHPSAGSSAPTPATDGSRDSESLSVEARAAALRAAGNQAMLEMRYVDALAAYQQAATLEPDYKGVLYSIARAHQLLGEFADALKTLERFNREASAETKAKVGGLERLFDELRARVGMLEVTCNVNGARVLFRGKVLGTTPL